MKKFVVWVVLMLLCANYVNAQVIRIPRKGKNPYREYVEECSDHRCRSVMVTLLEKSVDSVLIVQSDEWDQVMWVALADVLARDVPIGLIVSPEFLRNNRMMLNRLRLSKRLKLFVDGNHTLHNVIVIDEFVAVTGTLSTSLVVMHNPTIALVYTNQWMEHYQHSSK